MYFGQFIISCMLAAWDSFKIRYNFALFLCMSLVTVYDLKSNYKDINTFFFQERRTQVLALNNHEFIWFLFQLCSMNLSLAQQPLLNNPIHILNYSKKKKKKNYDNFLAVWDLVLILVFWKFWFCTENVEERNWDRENKWALVCL